MLMGHDAAGTWLPLDEHWARFDQDFWRISEGDFWKLEVGQTFHELESPSFDAFIHGDWNEALRLLTADKPGTQALYERVARAGFTAHRVRLVENPITPYLQWELHALAQRHECGERIRVITADQVRDLKADDRMIEITTLGVDITYELVYDDAGLQQGSVRYADPAMTARWRDVIADLYAMGEDFTVFFGREVALMPPPHDSCR